MWSEDQNKRPNLEFIIDYLEKMIEKETKI